MRVRMESMWTMQGSTRFTERPQAKSSADIPQQNASAAI